MMELQLGILIFASLTTVTLSGKWCTTSTGSQFCSHNCCDAGNGYDKCCDDDNDTSLVWLIPVCVIGGTLVISVVACLLCHFVKKQHHKGMVIQPQNQTQITTVPNGQYGYPTGFQQPPQYGSQFPQPQGGSQFPQPQGGTQFSNPQGGAQFSQPHGGAQFPQPQQTSDPSYPPPPAYSY